MNELTNAIGILQGYYNSVNGHYIAAEHDVIHLHATDRPLSKEDVRCMLEMGWFQERGARPEKADAYDPNDSWMHHT